MSDIVERLRRYIMPSGNIKQEAADEITRLRVELAGVTAERDRMREALRPLANELTELETEIPEWIKKAKDNDLLGLTYVLTLGDLRRARAALEGVTEPTTGDSNA